MPTHDTNGWHTRQSVHTIRLQSVFLDEFHQDTMILHFDTVVKASPATWPAAHCLIGGGQAQAPPLVQLCGLSWQQRPTTKQCCPLFIGLFQCARLGDGASTG